MTSSREQVLAALRAWAHDHPLTDEQVAIRARRHLRNLVIGVRGVPSIAKGERECALCDVPLRPGDEIVTCEGGALCPRAAGAWPCTIHADHREDPEA